MASAPSRGFPIAPLLLLLVAACAAPTLPEGEGRGLLAWDREPPAGAETFPRPVLRPGDRFVFRRGGDFRQAWTVREAGPEGYILEEEESGRLHLLDLDLGDLGEERPGDPEATRRLAPVDSTLHWPLWVGKRWRSHFLWKEPGQPPLPLLADYRCDALETVQVPAGTFRTLRIWRRVRVAARGEFVERTTLTWYAPEVGYVVRRLDDGILLELQEFHRQQPPQGSEPEGP